MPARRTVAKTQPDPRAALIERLHVIKRSGTDEGWTWLMLVAGEEVRLFNEKLQPVCLRHGLAIQVPKEFVQNLPIAEIDVVDEA